MRYSIRVTQTAVAEVLSLADAKAHLRITSTSEDGLIASYLAAALDSVQGFTSQVLADQEMEIAWRGFPAYPELLSIPRSPVTEIVSLSYADSDGADVAITDYVWSEAAADVVKPAFRTSWPYALSEPGSVRLRFRAGYEPDLVPPGLLQAVRVTLEHLYLNRGAEGAEMPPGAMSLCSAYRKFLI